MVAMYEMIRQAIKEDVEKIKPLRAGSGSIFTFNTNGNKFSVIREGKASLYSIVNFALSADNKEILVTNGSDVLQFKATLTLNDEGECRFKINGEAGDKDSWQVRRKALEELFFVGF